MDNYRERLNERKIELMPLCKSKADEFALLGYEHVSSEEIWTCVTSRYKEEKQLHQIVNDILSLKTTQFMNWLQMQVYRGEFK